MALVTTKWGTTQDPQFKINVEKAIRESVESSPELMKEINKVFKRANTRINRLIDSGLASTSPAYIALGNLGQSASAKYASRTYFTSKSYFDDGRTEIKDWNKIKYEYGLAVEFLNRETSTTSGAKQALSTMKSAYESSTGRHISDEDFQGILTNYSNDIAYMDQDLLPARYRHFLERFEDYIEETEKQMAQDAKKEADLFQNSLDAQYDELFTFIDDDIIGEIFK